jgi:hypothetical protein
MKDLDLNPLRSNNYNILKKNYNRYILNKHKNQVLSYFFDEVLYSQNTKEVKKTLYLLLKNEDILIDNDDIILIKNKLGLIASKGLTLSYDLVDFLIKRIGVVSKDSLSTLLSVLSLSERIKFFHFLLKRQNPVIKIYMILSTVELFSKNIIKKNLKSVKLDLNLMNKKDSAQFYQVFYRSNNILHENDLMLCFLEWMNENKFNFFKDIYSEVSYIYVKMYSNKLMFIDIIFRNSIYSIKDNKSFYKFFLKIAKNSDELKEVKSRGIFGMTNAEISHIKKDDAVDFNVMRAQSISRDIEKNKFNKIILILNNDNINLNKCLIIKNICSRFSNIEFVKKFFEGIKYNQKDTDIIDYLEIYSSIQSSFFQVEGKDESYYEVFYLLFKRISKNKLHYVDILNDTVLRGYSSPQSSSKSKFSKKMKVIYKAWKVSSGKNSIVNPSNYCKEMYIPIVQESFLSLFRNISSKDNFTKMYSSKKRIVNNMKDIYTKMDVYKLWIVEALFKNQINYDLINTYIETDIVYPIDDIIVQDISEVIKELKNFYTDKRIVKMLTNRINLQHLEDATLLFDYLKKENLLGSLMPKKPKTIDDVFVNMKLTMARLKDNNLRLNQKEIESLHDKHIGEYHVVVPKTHFALVKGGAILGQCVGDGHYTNSINNKDTFVLFIYKKQDLKFCVELNSSNLVINSSSGYKNHDVPKKIIKDLKDLIKGLKES